MINTTIKQVVTLIKQEIGPLYPDQETDAIIFRVLQHTLNFSRAQIFLQQDTNVPKTVLFEIENMVKALKNFEPLQYILGETCFYGHTFRVNPHVLIPRPETEELVEWVLQDHTSASANVIDLGTGSGCIAITIAKERPAWKVQAADLSEEALLLASENALLNSVQVDFVQENMLDFSENLTRQYFDVIVSNPPYVTVSQKAEMHPNVMDHEPHLALFAPGTDPLLFYRKIAAFASTNLKRGGKVYAEMNETLPEETAQLFKEKGFETELKKDIHSKYRMIKAFKND